jgi:hypothetical protein
MSNGSSYLTRWPYRMGELEEGKIPHDESDG